MHIYVDTICTSETRRFSPVAVRLIKHLTMPGGSPLKSYDLNCKPRSSDARPININLNDPTKCRTKQYLNYSMKMPFGASR